MTPHEKFHRIMRPKEPGDYQLSMTIDELEQVQTEQAAEAIKLLQSLNELNKKAARGDGGCLQSYGQAQLIARPDRAID